MQTLIRCVNCGAIFSDPGTIQVICKYCGVSHYEEIERYKLDGTEVQKRGPKKEKHNSG